MESSGIHIIFEADTKPRIDKFLYENRAQSHVHLDLFLFYVVFNSQGHIAKGRMQVEEPVHTSWSRFCTVNHRASACNYQLSNMKCPGRDLNQQPQWLKADTLTTTPPSHLRAIYIYIYIFFFLSFKILDLLNIQRLAFFTLRKIVPNYKHYEGHI